MKRRITLVLAAAGAVAAMAVGTSGTAFAASPSQTECEAAGGTFDRQQGQVTPLSNGSTATWKD